jgi:large subunit ribosomal protein L4
MALTAKYLQNKLIIIDEIKMDAIKTKIAIEMLKNFNLNSNNTCLIIDSQINKNFEKSSWNIKHINYMNSKALNVYDILKCDNLIMTKDSLKSIENRVIFN